MYKKTVKQCLSAVLAVIMLAALFGCTEKEPEAGELMSLTITENVKKTENKQSDEETATTEQTEAFSSEETALSEPSATTAKAVSAAASTSKKSAAAEKRVTSSTAAKKQTKKTIVTEAAPTTPGKSKTATTKKRDPAITYAPPKTTASKTTAAATGSITPVSSTTTKPTTTTTTTTKPTTTTTTTTKLTTTTTTKPTEAPQASSAVTASFYRLDDNVNFAGNYNSVSSLKKFGMSKETAEDFLNDKSQWKTYYAYVSVSNKSKNDIITHGLNMDDIEENGVVYINTNDTGMLSVKSGASANPTPYFEVIAKKECNENTVFRLLKTMGCELEYTYGEDDDTDLYRVEIK